VLDVLRCIYSDKLLSLVYILLFLMSFNTQWYE